MTAPAAALLNLLGYIGTTVELGLPVNLAPEKLVNAAAGGTAVVAAETARRRLG